MKKLLAALAATATLTAPAFADEWATVRQMQSDLYHEYGVAMRLTYDCDTLDTSASGVIFFCSAEQGIERINEYRANIGNRRPTVLGAFK